MSEQRTQAFDDDKLELLERQLADRITERIRPSLFRLYAAVGGAVIAVLGFVGWDVVTDIKKDAISQVTTDLDAEIKPKVEQINSIFIETRVLAGQANKVITEVKKQLELFEPQAAQLKQTFEDIGKLNSEIGSLAVDSRNFTTIYEQELTPALIKLDTLSDQLQILAEQVKELNDIALTQEAAGGDTAMPSQSDRTKAIESIIATTTAAEKTYSDVRDSSTVFIQFATATREQAKALADALKLKGYIVPGEDREEGAKNKRQVRYFHESDADNAKQLGKDTTSFLRDQGYTQREVPDVVAQSLVNYSGKKPRKGVLELWLDLPLHAPRAEATTRLNQANIETEDCLEQPGVRLSGTVKWFDPIKGYGFIQPKDGSNDIFVHSSALGPLGLQSLPESQKVEFVLTCGRKGQRYAEELRILE